MKSNTNLVISHIFWRCLYFFSVLLLNIAIARYFAAAKSGQIFFIVNNLAFILLIFSLSLESGATYYIASGKIEAVGIGRMLAAWSVVASLLATCIWALGLRLNNSPNLANPLFLPVCSIFILGVLLTTYFTALFYAKKEFILPNKILISVNGLLLILLLSGNSFAIVKSNFIQMYFASFFLQGILLMILFFANKNMRSVPVKPDKDLVKQFFRFSFLALLANAIYFLVNRIDYWYVEYYCSPSDLGNYIQASKLAQMLFVVPGILASTLFPIFSSQNKSMNSSRLAFSMRALIAVNGCICLGIAAFGWFLIPLFFGPSFNQVYFLFILLIPGILAVTMCYPIAAWFSAEKKISVNVRGSLIALFIICAGNWFFLPKYGVKAAAIISSAGYITYFLYSYVKYRKKTGVPLNHMLLLRRSDINNLLNGIRKNGLSGQITDQPPSKLPS